MAEKLVVLPSGIYVLAPQNIRIFYLEQGHCAEPSPILPGMVVTSGTNLDQGALQVREQGGGGRTGSRWPLQG